MTGQTLAPEGTSADVPVGPLVRRLGRRPYRPVWESMQAYTRDRKSESADEIWLVEHEPIYTLGTAGRREHLRRDNGIETIVSDRGGQVTYHGPGQPVFYILLDLRRLGLGVRELVRTLEAAVVDALAGFGVQAHGRVDAPGVYVGEAKIASLGLRVRNGCTYHGIALNVGVDLAPFADIDPCGIRGLAVTRLADLAPDRCALDVEQAVLEQLGARLRRPARSARAAA